MQVKEYFNISDPDLTKYLIDSEAPKEFEFDGKELKTYDSIAHLTHHQWLDAVELISTAKSDIDLMNLIVIFHWRKIDKRPFKKYTAESKLRQIEEMEAESAYPITMKYRELISKQIEKENETLIYVPDEKEMRAGYEKLNSFGDFGNRCNLATLFHCFPEDILKRKHNEIYYFLLYHKMKNECDKKYTKILSEK